MSKFSSFSILANLHMRFYYLAWFDDNEHKVLKILGGRGGVGKKVEIQLFLFITQLTKNVIIFS